jgi:hypothetical protein
MVSGPEGLESDVHMQPLVPRRLGIADDSQLIEKTSQLARRLADVREVRAGLRIEVPQRGHVPAGRQASSGGAWT